MLVTALCVTNYFIFILFFTSLREDKTDGAVPRKKLQKCKRSTLRQTALSPTLRSCDCSHARQFNCLPLFPSLLRLNPHISSCGSLINSKRRLFSLHSGHGGADHSLVREKSTSIGHLIHHFSNNSAIIMGQPLAPQL